MPRLCRSRLDAPFFHVLNRSVRKSPIFQRPPDYRAFLAVLQAGLTRFPVRLVAFCVLANHWHLVVEPAGTQALIRFMHWVTTTHAIRWHRLRDSVGQGPVYQGRYRAVPLDGMAGLIRTCRYVERNALTAGLVRRAQDWPWGSLAERLRQAPEVTLKPARFFASQAWIDHVNAEGLGHDHYDEPDGFREFGHRPTGPAAARPGTKTRESVENRYDPYPTSPRSQAVGPRRARTSGAASRAQTRIRPTPMLNVRNMSASDTPPER